MDHTAGDIQNLFNLRFIFVSYVYSLILFLCYNLFLQHFKRLFCANVTSLVNFDTFEMKKKKRSRRSLKKNIFFAIRFTSIIFDLGQFFHVLFSYVFASVYFLILKIYKCKMIDARSAINRERNECIT